MRPGPLGKGRLTILQAVERFVTGAGREFVVLGLEPGELCLEITDTLLETAHFRDHTRVRTADVAE